MSPPQVKWNHYLAYALGGAGWVMVDRLLLTWALFFYLPPDDHALPQRIPDDALFGIITLWGLISLGGRFIDAITDPLIATWSDRSRHPFGRRRIFMALSCIPVCLMCGLVFSPPFAAVSLWNLVYIAVILWAFYVFFTFYNVPYAALLPELGKTDSGCLKLSLWQAAAQLVSSGIVMIGAPLLLLALNSKGPSQSYQITAVIFSTVAGLLMFCPVVAISEPNLCEPPVQNKPLPVVQTLKELWRWKALRWFLLGTVGFWFGLNTVSTCVPYYATVLMGLSETNVSWLLGATFCVSGLCFPLVWVSAKRFGKARLMIGGALALAFLLFGLPWVNSMETGLVVMALAGIPTALVLALPPAILADMAREDRARSGQAREAMIFALLAFLIKVNLGVGAAVTAALLQLGKSAENPIGVQATGPVASIVLVGAAWCFWHAYNQEKASIEKT